MATLTTGREAPVFELVGIDGNKYGLNHTLTRTPILLIFLRFHVPHANLPFHLRKGCIVKSVSVGGKSGASLKIILKTAKDLPRDLSSRFPFSWMRSLILYQSNIT